MKANELAELEFIDSVLYYSSRIELWLAIRLKNNFCMNWERMNNEKMTFCTAFIAHLYMQLDSLEQ